MTLDDSYLSSLSRLRNARLRSESRAYRSEAGGVFSGAVGVLLRTRDGGGRQQSLAGRTDTRMSCPN
jgi:hypothetical protein